MCPCRAARPAPIFRSGNAGDGTGAGGTGTQTALLIIVARALTARFLKHGSERTIVEWQLTDLNGDGFPDFVFDSSPVDFQVTPPDSGPQIPVTGATRDGQIWEIFGPRRTNEIRAAYNVVGTRFDTDAQAFSLSVTLSAEAADQGVSQWRCGDDLNDECDESQQSEFFAITDVNGDGLADRVVGSKAYLGAFTGTAHPFSPVYVTLPGPLATQVNTHNQECAVGGSGAPTSNQTQGLRDLTGDGLPDYFDNGRVWIGTGTGFRPPVPIVTSGANFSFSHETESCDGKRSHTDGGLYDIDGDGKPEVVGLGANQLFITQLVGGRLTGNPESGRLIAVDNGYGAKTAVTYVSAKRYDDNPLPFPEIVVNSVATSGAHGLGGDLAGYRYAYGDGGLVFSSAADRFVFPGYGRQVGVRLFDATGNLDGAAGKMVSGAATITDAWPLDPFSTTLTKEQRWLRQLRVGHVRDVLTLRAVSNPDPWALLGVDASDPRVIGLAHYDWGAKLYETPPDAAANVLDCMDMVYPFDYRQTFASLLGSTQGVDVCRSHGFVFNTVSDTWRGDAPPPSDQNIETRAQTVDVDDFGRPVHISFENDVYRGDDDFCVENAYAAPTAPYPRVLTALSSRRVYDCKMHDTIASESWTYDALPSGLVADGRLTSKSTVRYATDTGAVLDTIHVYDAGYDSAGNITSVRTQRGADIRTTGITYDAFGIVPTHLTLEATGVPPQSLDIAYDPLSLEPLGTTDAN